MMMEEGPDPPDTMQNNGELNAPTATVSEEQFSWMQCVAGCVVGDDQEVVSLNCLHSICSDECLAKMKEMSLGDKLFCGVCKAEIAAKSLEHRIIPSQFFPKRSNLEDIVVACGNCVLELPAVAYCVDCDNGLCQTCKKEHSRVKSTNHHNVEDDLKESHKKRLVGLHGTSLKCPNHGDKNKTHHCIGCIKSMCEVCIEEHAGHEICNLEEVDKEIEIAAKAARNFLEKGVLSDQDIQEKKKELVQDFKQVNDNLDFIANVKIKSLLAHQNQLKKEVGYQFQKKVCGLQAKSKLLEKGEALCHNVLNACESIIKNGDEDAAIKFLEHYRTPLNKLTELDKTFEQDYDAFVEKDYHFQLVTGLESSRKQSQHGFPGWGHIEYIRKQNQAATAPSGTYSGVRKSTNVSDSAGNAPASDNEVPSTSAGILNTNNTEAAPKLQARVDQDSFNGAGRNDLSKQSQSQETAAATDGVQSNGLIDESQDNCTPGSSSVDSNLNLGRSEAEAKNNEPLSNDLEVVSSPVVDNGESHGDDGIILAPSSAASHQEVDDVACQSSNLTSGSNVVENRIQALSLNHDRPVATSPKPSGCSLPEKSAAAELEVGKRTRKKKEFFEILHTKKPRKFKNQQASSSKSIEPQAPSIAPRMPPTAQGGLVDLSIVKLEVENGNANGTGNGHASSVGNSQDGQRESQQQSSVNGNSATVVKRKVGRPRKHPLPE